MSYSARQRAIAGAEAHAGLNKKAKGSNASTSAVGTPVQPELSQEPPQRPPVHVSFEIEKKVGDATLRAYGGDGQEAEAKEKIEAAAKKFRSATQE